MNDFQVIERNGFRVLTTQQLADAYGTTVDVLNRNFNRNKERYVEGKHYICLTGDDLKEFRANGQIDLLPNINKFYLWTESGTLLHAKSLNTDKAWEVYQNLVDNYFRKKTDLLTEMLHNPNLAYMGFMKAISHNTEEISSVRKDFEEFKETMPVLGIDTRRLQNAKNHKVVHLLGGRDSQAYKNRSLTSKVYKDLNSQIFREFDISNTNELQRNQVEDAIAIIKNYELPRALKVQVDAANAQIRMEF